MTLNDIDKKRGEEEGGGGGSGLIVVVRLEQSGGGRRPKWQHHRKAWKESFVASGIRGLGAQGRLINRQQLRPLHMLMFLPLNASFSLCILAGSSRWPLLPPLYLCPPTHQPVAALYLPRQLVLVQTFLSELFTPTMVKWWLMKSGLFLFHFYIYFFGGLGGGIFN